MSTGTTRRLALVLGLIVASPVAWGQANVMDRTFDEDDFSVGQQLDFNQGGPWYGGTANLWQPSFQVTQELFEVTQNGVDGTRSGSISYDTTFADPAQLGAGFWVAQFGFVYAPGDQDPFDDGFTTTDFSQIVMSLDVLPFGVDPSLGDVAYRLVYGQRPTVGGEGNFRVEMDVTFPNPGEDPAEYTTLEARFSEGTITVGTENDFLLNPAEHTFQIEIADGGNNYGFGPGKGLHFDNLKVFEDFGSGILLGDYNDSGQVEQGDLDLVLQNWGVDTDANGLPVNWINDNVGIGVVEQAELDRVLQNWGSTSAPRFAGTAVPEPASLVLLGVAGVFRRRR